MEPKHVIDGTTPKHVFNRNQWNQWDQWDLQFPNDYGCVGEQAFNALALRTLATLYNALYYLPLVRNKQELRQRARPCFPPYSEEYR